jgi:hypothetical protein
VQLVGIGDLRTGIIVLDAEQELAVSPERPGDA